MRIYFSGIGGAGIGPLAEIARDAGHEVLGSDKAASLTTGRLIARNMDVHIGQDGAFLASCHKDTPVDWFVYTSALPANHPELQFAKEHSIRSTKRDELLAHIIKEKGLKLIAVAGTHGKTTTTAMLVWLAKQLNIAVSYSIGTEVSFGSSGKFDEKSEYFIYECDEYDRNFLHFSPYASIITSLDYDHPDTYPTLEDYKQAFKQFLGQSERVYIWQRDKAHVQLPDAGNVYAAPDSQDVSSVHLAGEHVRRNGFLAAKAASELFDGGLEKCLALLSNFPGTSRRFEKVADNLYLDYGHHPTEIAATLQLARELNDRVVLVYQPHQNQRQHGLKDSYTTCMELAEKIYWVPTYLAREDESLRVLTPEELSSKLTNKNVVTFSDLNDELWRNIQKEQTAGKLVLVMSAAAAVDSWVRNKLKT